MADTAAGIERALEATCASLEKERGADLKNWQWGRLHTLVLDHPFADAFKILKGWNMPHGALAGNDSTVSVAGTSRRRATSETSFIPSIRLVTPLSDVSKATFIYPGGQSGQPESKHYSDLFAAYIAGETRPLYFSERDVKAKALDILTLTRD
jgi:penicillin amidase